MLLDSLSQLMTHSGPKGKFSWLYLFAITSYRNFIISIVFYCFRHLWRHNLPNIDLTVLICYIKPHFTLIHHLWKFHFFSISRTYLKNSAIYGVAQNRQCEVGLKCRRPPTTYIDMVCTTYIDMICTTIIRWVEVR